MDTLIDRRNYWAKHFSRQAMKYPEDEAKSLDFSNKKLMSQVHDTVLQGIEPESVTSILDAGSGLGNLIERFGSNLKGVNNKIEFYGIDVSFEMLKKSNDKIYALHTKPIFLLMDFICLGFKDSSLDCSICSESIQYSDPYAALEELIRVTRNQVLISC
jgi:ubiquinone/menaquinone biosynthesis C-methylase UbiE